jgi:hypothetical protein
MGSHPQQTITIGKIPINHNIMQNFIKVFDILLATFLLSLHFSAQSITELQSDLNHIKLNLEQHHKQYKTGSGLIITGLIASSSDMVLNAIANKPENQWLTNSGWRSCLSGLDRPNRLSQILQTSCCRLHQ